VLLAIRGWVSRDVRGARRAARGGRDRGRRGRPDSLLTERELRGVRVEADRRVQIPRRVVFVEQIPKGPTGRSSEIGLAKKLGIESLAFAQPGGSVAFEAPRSETGKSVIAERWRAVLAIDRWVSTTILRARAGDSLAAVDAIERVKARWAVTINIRDMGFGTLRQWRPGATSKPGPTPDRGGEHSDRAAG